MICYKINRYIAFHNHDHNHVELPYPAACFRQQRRGLFPPVSGILQVFQSTQGCCRAAGHISGGPDPLQCPPQHCIFNLHKFKIDRDDQSPKFKTCVNDYSLLSHRSNENDKSFLQKINCRDQVNKTFPWSLLVNKVGKNHLSFSPIRCPPETSHQSFQLVSVII